MSLGWEKPRAGVGMRPLRRVLIPVFAGAVALGVAGAGRVDRSETRSATYFTVSQTAQDSLGLELVLPRRVRAGEPVPIKLRVRNQSQRGLDLYLRGRTSTFDVVVARAGGEVVWRRLEDEIIPAIVHLRTLAPAARFELEAVWDQRTKQGRLVEPGDYTARGLLLTEGDPLETTPATFRIDQP